MEIRTVSESMTFSEEKMQKNTLFDSSHLFYDAYCLRPGQSQKVHSHEGSDKIYYVLSGAARVTIGDEEQDLSEGQAVIARAGDPHGVRNESDGDLALLVTMAPRPS